MNKHVSRPYLLEHAEDIRRMYCDEHKTTREIGEHFGTSKHPILDAMKILGIPGRTTKTRGTKPTKEFLEKAINKDHRDLQEIARSLKCDIGAVQWWCKEFGIDISHIGLWTQRNARRNLVKPDKEMLENLYLVHGMSARVIADSCQISPGIVLDLLAEYGIEKRRDGWNPVPFVCADGHSVRSLYEQRVDNWLSENSIPHVYEPRLPFSKLHKADFLAYDYYIEIFGVRHSQIYEHRKAKKINLYQANGCKLITINFWDFDKYQNDLWIRKLSVLRTYFPPSLSRIKLT